MDKTIRFTDSVDGINSLACYTWPSEGEPRGIVQLVHGMAEYMERYDGFARFLSQNGFVVYGNDHIGHGKSAEKGTLGFMGEEQGWRYMLGDIRNVGKMADEENPGLPRIMLGHSMGTMLARIYIAKHGRELAGCVLTGLVQKQKMQSISEFMCNREIKKLGPKGVSDFMVKMAFGKYNARIPDAKSPNSWLSTDDAVVEAYDKDPLCGFPFTVSGFRDMLSMSRIIFARDYYEKIPKDLPIMIAVGTEDPCGGYGKGAREEARKMKDAGADVIYKEYSEMRHEILNEKKKAAVYDDILAFMNTTLSTRANAEETK